MKIPVYRCLTCIVLFLSIAMSLAEGKLLEFEATGTVKRELTVHRAFNYDWENPTVITNTSEAAATLVFRVDEPWTPGATYATDAIFSGHITSSSEATVQAGLHPIMANLDESGPGEQRTLSGSTAVAPSFPYITIGGQEFTAQSGHYGQTFGQTAPYLRIDRLEFYRMHTVDLPQVDLSETTFYTGFYKYKETFLFENVQRIHLPRWVVETPAHVEYETTYPITVRSFTHTGDPDPGYAYVFLRYHPWVGLCRDTAADGLTIPMTNGVGTCSLEITDEDYISSNYGDISEFEIWARDETGHILSASNTVSIGSNGPIEPVPEHRSGGLSSGAFYNQVQQAFQWNSQLAPTFLFAGPSTSPSPAFASTEYDRIPHEVSYDAQPGRTYYWRVASHFGEDGFSTGSVWRFNTEPDEARNPYPNGNAQFYTTSTVSNVRLEWDADNAYRVENEVLFQPYDGPGKPLPDPVTIACGTQQWCVVPYPLEVDRDYLWNVRTMDADATRGDPAYVTGDTWSFQVAGSLANAVDHITVSGPAEICHPGGSPATEIIASGTSKSLSVREGTEVRLLAPSRLNPATAFVETATEVISGGPGRVVFKDLYRHGEDFRMKVEATPALGAAMIRARNWESQGIIMDYTQRKGIVDVEQVKGAQKDTTDFLVGEAKETATLKILGLATPLAPFIAAYEVYDKVGDAITVGQIAYKYASATKYPHVQRTFQGCVLRHGPPPPAPGAVEPASLADMPIDESLFFTECVVSHRGGLVEVYVFKGDYSFSDPAGQKTVHLTAGTRSTWQTGQLPTNPVGFDVHNPPVVPWSEELGSSIMETESWTFSDGNTAGWQDDGVSNWQVRDDAYTVTGSGTGRRAFSILDGVYEDVFFKADVRKTAGQLSNMEGGFGLVFRYNGPQDYGLFRINTTGQYQVLERRGGTDTVVVDTTDSQALRPGISSLNTLSLVDEQGEIKFYANTVLLTSQQSFTLPAGRVGLYAGLMTASSPPDQVQFDQVIRVGDPRPPAVYVSPSGSNVAPYDSWDTAAHSIEDAVATAGGNGRVRIGNGIYHVTTPVYMTTNVTVQAAGAPGGVLVDGGGVTRPFHLAHPGAVLDGVTVVNGFAGDGGGVYLTGGTVQNTTVSNCTATRWGGGITLYRGGVVDRCTVVNNSANKGGGIYLYEGGEVRSSRMTGNSASEDDSDRQGGGIYIRGSGGQVTDCAIEHNTSLDHGGGVSFYNGDGSSLRNSILRENECNVYGGGIYFRSGGEASVLMIQSNRAEHGGGVMMYDGGSVEASELVGNTSVLTGGGGTVYLAGTLTDCVGKHNASSTGGGFMLQQGGLMDRCTIVSNAMTEVGNGGGINLYRGGELRNTLVAYNQAAYGAGVYAYEAGGVVENCTVLFNRATSKGGGIRCLRGGTLYNTILYDNLADVSGENFYNTDTGDISYQSCITTPAPSLANVTVDSLRTSPPAFVDAARGNFYLMDSSPGVNTGTYRTWMADALDLNGYPRVLGGTADRGAYEFNSLPDDRDGDGLSDADEQHVLGTSAGHPDSDGDGAWDGNELSAGTDPWDPQSLFQITGLRRDPVTRGMVLEWSSVQGKRYALKNSDDLQVIPAVLEDEILAYPPVNTRTVEVERLSGQFFRVEIDP